VLPDDSGALFLFKGPRSRLLARRANVEGKGDAGQRKGASWCPFRDNQWFREGPERLVYSLPCQARGQGGGHGWRPGYESGWYSFQENWKKTAGNKRKKSVSAGHTPKFPPRQLGKTSAEGFAQRQGG